MCAVSLFGTIARGKLAGAVGTVAMDSLLYWRYRRAGGEDGFADWEFATGVKDWSSASAPAQVGKRLAADLLHWELPPEAAAPTTNIVHWATGIGWGGMYALATRSKQPHHLVPGLLFGAGVWATSYAVLPRFGVYQPIWEYDGDVLWRDLSAHLVYGVVTAAAFRALSRAD